MRLYEDLEQMKSRSNLQHWFHHRVVETMNRHWSHLCEYDAERDFDPVLLCLMSKNLIAHDDAELLRAEVECDVCGLCPRTDKMMRQVLMHLVNPERFASFMECLEAHMHMPEVIKSMQTMLLI